MWRRSTEPEITREDVNSIMSYLMGIDDKVEQIRSFLLEDADEQEDA
jgi:hypothetical protein